MKTSLDAGLAQEIAWCRGDCDVGHANPDRQAVANAIARPMSNADRQSTADAKATKAIVPCMSLPKENAYVRYSSVYVCNKNLQKENANANAPALRGAQKEGFFHKKCE